MSAPNEADTQTASASAGTTLPVYGVLPISTTGRGRITITGDIQERADATGVLEREDVDGLITSVRQAAKQAEKETLNAKLHVCIDLLSAGEPVEELHRLYRMERHDTMVTAPPFCTRQRPTHTQRGGRR
jgi:hypothetical protein